MRRSRASGSSGKQMGPRGLCLAAHPGRAYSAQMTTSEPRSERLTAAQRDALAAELAELEGPKRTAVVQAIKTAREHGDLSENFEYHAAKNEQGLLEARIRTLRSRLDNA